jgi:hypothetical protein
MRKDLRPPTRRFSLETLTSCESRVSVQFDPRAKQPILALAARSANGTQPRRIYCSTFQVKRVIQPPDRRREYQQTLRRQRGSIDRTREISQMGVTRPDGLLPVCPSSVRNPAQSETPRPGPRRIPAIWLACQRRWDVQCQPSPVEDLVRYSFRSATIGSMRDARRAGTKQARTETVRTMRDATIAVGR